MTRVTNQTSLLNSLVKQVITIDETAAKTAAKTAAAPLDATLSCSRQVRCFSFSLVRLVFGSSRPVPRQRFSTCLFSLLTPDIIGKSFRSYHFPTFHVLELTGFSTLLFPTVDRYIPFHLCSPAHVMPYHYREKCSLGDIFLDWIFGVPSVVIPRPVVD